MNRQNGVDSLTIARPGLPFIGELMRTVLIQICLPRSMGDARSMQTRDDILTRLREIAHSTPGVQELSEELWQLVLGSELQGLFKVGEVLMRWEVPYRVMYLENAAKWEGSERERRITKSD